MTNHTDTPTAKEAIMSKSFPRPSDEALGLRDGWAAGKSASRVLSAIGHPGYGEAFARRVLAHMAATGCTAHQAVYGAR